MSNKNSSLKAIDETILNDSFTPIVTYNDYTLSTYRNRSTIFNSEKSLYEVGYTCDTITRFKELSGIDGTILNIYIVFALFKQVPVSVINCVKEKYCLQYSNDDGSVDIQLYVEKEGVFLLYKLIDPEHNCFAIDYVFDYNLDGVACAFYNALKIGYTATFNGLDNGV